MRGLLGQYVFAIPALNAVVVRLGDRRAEEMNAEWNYPKDIDVWLDAAFEMLDAAPRRASLIFGGDMMQHTPQIHSAKAVGKGVLDYEESFRYLKPLLESADAAIVNLETTLTMAERYTGFPLFRSPKEIAAALHDVGFDIALMANNHVLDGGATGVLATMQLLDSAGIRYTGIFRDCEHYVGSNPLLFRAGNMNFALLNYTYGTNGLPTPAGLSVNRIDSFTIARDIAGIDRRDIDAVIVCFHWGVEYARKPGLEQRQLAALCHRLGAEIVIGSHPHVIQPVEYIEDEEGNITGITVFSLGNLVSKQRERYSDGGLIAHLKLTKEKDKKLLIKPLYIPVWVSLPGYKILPPSVPDTLQMTIAGRKQYDTFYKDTYEMLKDALR